MKKNAIMLADTRPALVGTVLLQLKNTNPNLYSEAIIYYVDTISEKDQLLMNSIMPCRFVRYMPPLPEELFEKPRFKRFSILMFCRYEMFSYLDEFNTVTWLDTDILIQGNLSKMVAAAEKTGAVFIREDPINKTAEKPDYMRTCFQTEVPEFSMNEYLYCSGTIVLSKKIGISTECTKWCYDYTIKWADILDLPDQGVLNAAIQQFNIKVEVIPGKLYCCYPSINRDCSKAYIIHAWGSNKFWNDWYIYKNYSDWKRYYENWKNLGGTLLGYDIEPSISIIIPSYKPNLKFMRECLDSLMSQNRNGWERFSDFEIIIVSEPFDQESLQILIDSYNDKRIQLLFNEKRLGIAASLNKGIRLAKGRYIARVDDDDICANARLFLQKEYLDKHTDIVLCTTDFEYFGDMNERRISFEGEMSYAWSIFTCPFDHPTIMFRREFFAENGLFYDEKRGYVEDWELWRRAFKKGMTVGCIHEVLFYHRWINTGSAGQTNKTVEMMRELIRKNFLELDVDIPIEDLKLIGPWNGKLLCKDDEYKLEEYLKAALKGNCRKKLYNQECLEKIFDLRISEAKTGILSGLSEKIEQQEKCEVAEEKVLSNTVQEKRKLYSIKKLLKKLLLPFYKPFYNRYEKRLINIQNTEWVNEGHIMDCIAKLDQILAVQHQQIQDIQYRQNESENRIIELLKQQINLNNTIISLQKREKVRGNTIVDLQYNQISKIDKLNSVQQKQIMEIEKLNDFQYQQISKINQSIDLQKTQLIKIDRMDSLQEQQIIKANEIYNLQNQQKNIYENINKSQIQYLDKIKFICDKQAEELNNVEQNLTDIGEKISEIRQEEGNQFHKLDDKLSLDNVFLKMEEMHRHIDFTYRDIMVALEKQSTFLPASDVIIKTEYPIASDSLDHLFPHGTVRDNTRYPRFVKKCEEIIKQKKLFFLDLGCSGGGMVLEAALRGHFSIGLEGSDYSYKEQRAEWRLLGNRLMTCDITKPFLLEKHNGDIQQFDVITAWEVMEHIAEKDLTLLFENIKKHLKPKGIFVASIANWNDIDPISGVNWHVTVYPYEWWKNKFESAGFKVCTELIDTIDLARGGYNPPHCYEQPYPDLDFNKSFHIVACKY